MHTSVHSWVADQVQRWGLDITTTLDIGSKDENGTVRDLFTGPYTGLDMRPGPNVDIVAMSHHLPFPADSFDTVVCCEMLEHDPRFWVTMREIGRVLRPGGWLLLTTRSNGFPTHGYPDDYWRFSLSTLAVLASEAGCELVEGIVDPLEHHPGVFMAAHKPEFA